MTRTPLTVLVAVAVLGLSVLPVRAQDGQMRKVSPNQLQQYWVRTGDHVDASVPNSGNDLNKLGCAAVTYVVGSDGRTHDVQVRKIVPKTSDLKITASTLVKALHFVPGPDNQAGAPVATYLIVPFNVPDGDQDAMQRMLKACHLPGYGH